MTVSTKTAGNLFQGLHIPSDFKPAGVSVNPDLEKVLTAAAAERGQPKIPEIQFVAQIGGNPYEAGAYQTPGSQSRQGLSSIRVPSFDELRRGNFHENMTRLFAAVGEDLPHVKQALAEANQNGYRFVLYDPADRNVPASVRANMARNTVSAVTDHDTKRVYFNFSAIENFRSPRGESKNQFLVEAIADESVHLLRRVKPTPDNYYKVLQEEALAYMIGHIVAERFSENPSYQLPAGALKDGTVRFSKFAVDFDDYKFRAARQLHVSMFGQQSWATPQNMDAWYALPREQREDKANVDQFLRSGKMEGFIEYELKRYGLLAE